MKRKISMFLCVVLVVTTMSGISPIKLAQAAESTDFYTEKEAVTDYAYSFAVVGDTQIVTEYDVNNNAECLSGIYDWILSNKDSKKIEYVFGLGDITDNNNEAEWSLAKEQISKLNGQIPYSIVRGNHDLVGAGTPKDKTADYFTQYLGTNEYKNQFEEGGFYSEENIWNSWRTFTVGDVDYLMLSLDWGASDAVLSWAGNVISEYSTYNVIVSTHGYAYSDGTTVGTGEGGMSTADNNGEAMWEKFVSKYENIVLVLSGHVPSEDIVVSQDEGVNGNIVTSMLVDPQDVDAAEVAAGNTPLGAIAMLYFSEDGKHVQVEYYATAREAYYKENNQFSFEVASVSKALDDCERVVKDYTADEAAKYLAGEDYYPELDGYVFAGWYTNEKCDESCALRGKTPSGTTYALFVPKHMLSVKAQISANLIDSDTTNDATGSIRFVTTIDSLLYKEAGFEISYENDEGNTVSTTSGSNKALRKLYVLDSINKWGKTPEGTFCGVSKYFKACLLKNVSMSKHYNTVFTLKPYFITLDGDKVYGEPAEKSFAQGCEDSKVAINIHDCENGSVTATEDVHWGNTVTLTVSPESEAYLCESLLVNGWDVVDDLVANDDGTYSYNFTAMEGSYTVVPKISRRIFKNSTTLDVSKQFEGMVSRTTYKNPATAVLYDTYTDVDITLENVKHRTHEDTTKTYGSRMDVMFQFDVDNDQKYTSSADDADSKDRNVSFSIITNNTNTNNTIIQTLGIKAPTETNTQYITDVRQETLYTLDDDEVSRYHGENDVEGVDFRVIRSGTTVSIYLDGKEVVENFDLTQNESGVTADTEAIITLRYYEGNDEEGDVIIPFEISDSVSPIFTTTGATGTWDLTEKYKGVVTVDSSSTASVVLPFAKKYTNIDLTLSNVKHRDNNVNSSATYGGRTDVLFEFDTVDDEGNAKTETVSFGVMRRSDGQTWVRTLGINNKTITTTRVYELYQLTDDEVKAFNCEDGEDGIDFRIIRLDAYIYVFVEGKQVAEFDITQNGSNVAADTEAKVSLRHYDVKAEAIEFPFTVTEQVEEAVLDIASNENGNVTTQTIICVTDDTSVSKNSTKHFVGEKINLTVTPTDEDYACAELKVNGQNVANELVTNDDETYSYSFTTMEDNYTVVPTFTRRIFSTDATAWDVSKQFEGEVSLSATTSTGLRGVEFYDTYTDFDLTLHNVKHHPYTETAGGRTEVLFEFDTDTATEGFEKTASFGILERSKDPETYADQEGIGTVAIEMMGVSGTAITSRFDRLYYLTDAEEELYYGEEGIDFRVVRLGTTVYIYLENRQVCTYDLAQASSGVTEEMPATMTLRYYDGKEAFTLPFELSNTVDPIFTTDGAEGTWDLTNKYNGVVTVNSNSDASVVLPFAKKYKNIDLTLSNVKHRDNNVSSSATYGGRTDVLFEFDTVDDEGNAKTETVSFGVMRRSDGQTWVRTLGINNKTITTTRVYELYQLTDDEVKAFNCEDGEDGIDFRVIRLGAYIYVFVEGKQVAEFDITQANSNVTADMEAKVSLRHYDVKADAIEFPFTVTEDVEEVTLDIASNENGTIATQTITCVTNDTSVIKNSTKHFIGETVTLIATPNSGYRLKNLEINNKKIEQNTYTLPLTKKQYFIEAFYEAE